MYFVPGQINFAFCFTPSLKLSRELEKEFQKAAVLGLYLSVLQMLLSLLVLIIEASPILWAIKITCVMASLANIRRILS